MGINWVYGRPSISKKSTVPIWSYGRPIVQYDATLPDTDEGKETDPEFKSIIQLLIEAICRLIRAIFRISPMLAMSGTVRMAALTSEIMNVPDVSVARSIPAGTLSSTSVGSPGAIVGTAPVPIIRQAWNGGD